MTAVIVYLTGTCGNRLLLIMLPASHVCCLTSWMRLHHSTRLKVLIDGVEQVAGPLATADWGPPLQPPETISDPKHVKPDDWVEEEM